MTFRCVLLLLVASVASPLYAFRPRPVSDVAFENHLPGAFVCAASDGEDFLVVWRVRWTRMYAQRVSRGERRGPAVFLGDGSEPTVTWNGTSYVVAWQTYNEETGKPEIALARVSREGTLLGHSVSRIPRSGTSFQRLASNGSKTILLFGTTAGTLGSVRIDANGELTGEPATISDIREPYVADAKPFRDGFVAVVNARNDLRVLFFDIHGAPKSSTVVAGPFEDIVGRYRAQRCMIATNGGEIAIVFTWGAWQRPDEIRTAILDSNGAVVHGPAILASDGPGASHGGASPRAMEWDGAAFVISTSISSGNPISHDAADAVIYRINRQNARMGNAFVLARGDRRRQQPSALVIGRGEMLVAWDDETNQDDFGPYFASFPLGAPSAMRPPVRLGRVQNQQTAMAVAAGTNEYLAVWEENEENRKTTRASRIDRNGNYLDGRGVVIGERSGAASIATDGFDWLVSSGGVTALLTVSGGQLRVKRTIDLHLPLSVAWGDGAYLGVTAGPDLIAVSISRDGVIQATTTLARENPFTQLHYASPSIAFDGRYFVVVALEGTPWSAVNFWGVNYDLVAMRVTGGAAPRDPLPIRLAKSVQGYPLIASNGTHNLIVVGERALLLPAPAAPVAVLPFTIAKNETSFSPLFVGEHALVATSGGRIVRVIPPASVEPVTALAPDASRSASAFSLAANHLLPPLLGFVDTHDDQRRAAALFLSELAAGATPPAAPVAIDVVRGDDDSLRVAWRGVASAFGYAIEVRLLDGTWREVGVAGGSATSARVALAGLQPVSARVLAWNNGGASEPSNEVWPKRRRASSSP